MNAALRVFLNSFSVAKECRMKPDNTNLSSYNPSRTLNLGTEQKCGYVIKITSFTQVLSTRLRCLMDDGAGLQVCFFLVPRLNFGAKIRNKLNQDV